MKLNSLHYVGVNDRKKTLFEQMIPIPNGVSYNSYLAVDKQITLFDTVEVAFFEQFIENIEAVINDRPIDYLVIHHVEPDHSSSIRALVRQYPNIKLIGNKKTIEMISGFYGNFTNFIEVKDGDCLDLGGRILRFFLTPMVHWPEVMMSYDEVNNILFSADAFGCFGTLDGAILDTQLPIEERFIPEMYRYYANIVGKYGAPVQAALKKLEHLKIDMICSLHGPIWTEKVDRVVDIYNDLSLYNGQDGVVVVYGSMYGNTEKMAEAAARGAAEQGVRVVIHDVSKSDASDILADIFKYKGLIIGCPTYCNELYPPIAALLKKIETRGIKNRVFASFGSFSWASVVAKQFTAFSETMKWQMIDVVEKKHAPNKETLESMVLLGKKCATKL